METQDKLRGLFSVTSPPKDPQEPPSDLSVAKIEQTRNQKPGFNQEERLEASAGENFRVDDRSKNDELDLTEKCDARQSNLVADEPVNVECPSNNIAGPRDSLDTPEADVVKTP